jgi:predicted GNAT superfamily acetyltransferase
LAIPSDRGVFLIAGSTAPWARGRGLYRALVRARWDYAVERGTPALVTEAIVATSYPILQRLGFTEVCTIWRLQETREASV